MSSTDSGTGDPVDSTLKRYEYFFEDFVRRSVSECFPQSTIWKRILGYDNYRCDARLVERWRWNENPKLRQFDVPEMQFGLAVDPFEAGLGACA